MSQRNETSLLAEVSHDEAKMRENLLPHRERPLLAGKSRTQTQKKFLFNNWLYSFFTWLFLYHKEVTKSLFPHLANRRRAILPQTQIRKFGRMKFDRHTLSYHMTRSWYLCLYFFKCCFLLDAEREKYSYISHAFHLRVAKNLFNNFFMTWAHTEFAYLL